MRLRQAVVVAAAVEPLAAQLRGELGLGAPYDDPGVGEFGIRNAVMAAGDCFIEVIAPVDAEAPCRRRLDQHGPGGYMLIVQVDDAGAARRRAEVQGVRIVWQADLPDISGTHLHPRDLGGTLLSVDEARPPATWHWAGPAWTGRTPPPRPGGLAGVTIAVRDPAPVAARWAAVLDREPIDEQGAQRIELDSGWIRFVSTADSAEGIVSFDVALAPEIRAGRDHLDAGGVRFTLVDAGPA